MSKKNKFNKPALNLDEKVELLEKRGLIFDDKEKAKHDIQHIGYFRLTGYFKFYQDTKTNLFIEGITFKQIINLYAFDRKLRLLTIDAIEKIEVSLKSNINDILSEKYGVFWYLNKDLFFLKREKFKGIYSGLLKIIKNKQSTSSSLFVKEYFKKYDGDFLPSWMLFEDLTIGEIGNIYTILKGYIQKEISLVYGIDFIDLVNWIQLIRNLRNISAHHGRLWNRKYTIRLTSNDKILGTRIKKDNETNKTIPNYFNATLVIHYFLNKINKNFSWLNDLDALFEDFPMIPKEKMGFSDKWKEEFEQ